MKKKLLAMVLICALAVSVCACGSTDSTGGTGGSSKQEEKLPEAATTSVDKIGDDVDEIALRVYDNPADGTYTSYWLYMNDADGSAYQIFKLEAACRAGQKSSKEEDDITTTVDIDADAAKELAAYFDEHVADQFPAESYTSIGVGDDTVYENISIEVDYKDDVHEEVIGKIMENEEIPDWVDGFVALFEEKLAN